MNVILCLDNNNGMMFNRRRQSQDKVLREDIKKFTSCNNIFMNEYSYKLYKDIDNGNIKVCENFLRECGSDDFCLVESNSLNEYLNQINKIIVYKWNRLYPADLYFDITLDNNSWELIETEEFQGSSHDKITKEIYRRIN